MHTWLRGALKNLVQMTLTRDTFVWRLQPTGIYYVALTFDDGPNPIYTYQILEMLKAESIKATFFLIGGKVEKYPEVARSIVEEGHSVGGHTYLHGDVSKMSQKELVADLERTRQIIKRECGLDTKMFRPPRGRFNLRTLWLVKKHDYRLIHWARTYSDYLQEGAMPLEKRMHEMPPRYGDIILLHDHNQYTLDALEVVLPVWRKRGMEFVRL